MIRRFYALEDAVRHIFDVALYPVNLIASKLDESVSDLLIIDINGEFMKDVHHADVALVTNISDNDFEKCTGYLNKSWNGDLKLVVHSIQKPLNLEMFRYHVYVDQVESDEFYVEIDKTLQDILKSHHSSPLEILKNISSVDISDDVKKLRTINTIRQVARHSEGSLIKRILVAIDTNTNVNIKSLISMCCVSDLDVT